MRAPFRIWNSPTADRLREWPSADSERDRPVSGRLVAPAAGELPAAREASKSSTSQASRGSSLAGALRSLQWGTGRPCAASTPSTVAATSRRAAGHTSSGQRLEPKWLEP
eukprot:CAMPEP_0175730750 /NCGR_PEP_ID=MMETSP0097-20121207/50483_1 /TAXON_ID=311494 /ORGANISM="Alexandrium monilatum, Strain CCMP3105" /LENGTH=109 /DNA_ID=CAMNT_0017038659 /DNA_START=146 /DNA_END=472 /DNA_ORIENTATION=+